ncbi:MAG TPA: hypothetical protein VHB25_20420 [Gemmatimonadaceae bacterium]|nr:hypothetical protein [Gemmatimonadaceae bacterium]
MHENAILRFLYGALVAASGCAGGTPSALPARAPMVVWAFTAPWDPRSDSSLRANVAPLNTAVTGWIQLDSATAAPIAAYRDDAAVPGTTRRFALVTSWHGQRFHPESVRRLGNDSALLAQTASSLAALLRQGAYAGMVLDLEGSAVSDVPLVARVVRALGDSARAHGVATIAMAVPAADTTAYPARAFLRAADLIVAMLYDEHWATSAPGPVASPEWVRRALGARVAEVGAAHVVAALPVYGYQWRANQPAQPVSFEETRSAASQAGVELVRDPASLSLHAIAPGEWELWTSDAVQLRALADVVRATGVSAVALWRLGLEDPGVWRALR